MAGSEPELFDLYQCEVCFNSLLEQTARTLRCNHTYCETCLNQLLKKKTITCPRCRENTIIQSVNNLPINTDLKKMKEREEDLIKNREKYCTSCSHRGNAHEAVATCLQCHKVLCLTCTSLHNKTPAFKKHQVVTFKRGETKDGCDAHGSELGYVCLECMKLVCCDCVLDEPHRNHSNKIHDYQEAQTILSENIETVHNKVRDILQYVSQSLRLVRKKGGGSGGTKDSCVEHSKSISLLDEVECVLDRKAQDVIQFYGEVKGKFQLLDTLCVEIKGRCQRFSDKKLAPSTEGVKCVDVTHELAGLQHIELEIHKVKDWLESLSINVKNYKDTVIVQQMDEFNLRKPIGTIRQIFEFDGDKTVLRSPSEMDISGGHVFVSDHRYNFVRMITKQGRLSASFYPVTPDDTTINAARAFGQNLYIGLASGAVTCIPLNNIEGTRSVTVPDTHISGMGIMDQENILLLDAWRGEIKHFNMAQCLARVVATGFQDPQFISEGWHNNEKIFIVTEMSPQMIKVFDSKWKLTASFAVAEPFGTAILPSGSILISQPSRCCVSEYTIQGFFVRHVLTRENGICGPRHIRRQGQLLAIIDIPTTVHATEHNIPKPSVKLFEFL